MADQSKTTADANTWHSMPHPDGEIVIVRGGDGREHLYRDGVIFGSGGIPVVPREWRWLVEEIDV